jgi:hypothetical protein
MVLLKENGRRTTLRKGDSILFQKVAKNAATVSFVRKGKRLYFNDVERDDKVFLNYGDNYMFFRIVNLLAAARGLNYNLILSTSTILSYKFI